jgi:hypothetical protein
MERLEGEEGEERFCAGVYPRTTIAKNCGK